MDENLKNKILQNIKATGFPLELEVARILKSDSWNVEQNNTYLDYESNKSREIDVTARKAYAFKDNNNDFYVGINLIIEIKKATKRPWIIFTIPNEKKTYSDFIGPGFGQLLYTYNFSVDRLSAISLMKDFPRNKVKSIGTSFYEAFKDVEEPSKIYEAIMSAVKASFYKRRLENGDDYLSTEDIEEMENQPFNPNVMQRLEIYMPIVIIEGILCEANLTDDNEIEIKENAYLPLTISHSVKPYLDHYDYYPEILHINFLKSFVEEINIWGKSIIDLWKKD